MHFIYAFVELGIALYRWFWYYVRSIFLDLKGEIAMRFDGATGLIKKAMRAKRVRQADIAERTGTSPNTVRLIMAKTNINTDTLISYADALGCDVALIDRETGEIYR